MNEIVNDTQGLADSLSQQFEVLTGAPLTSRQQDAIRKRLEAGLDGLSQVTSDLKVTMAPVLVSAAAAIAKNFAILFRKLTGAPLTMRRRKTMQEKIQAQHDELDEVPDVFFIGRRRRSQHCILHVSSFAGDLKIIVRVGSNGCDLFPIYDVESSIGMYGPVEPRVIATSNSFDAALGYFEPYPWHLFKPVHFDTHYGDALEQATIARGGPGAGSRWFHNYWS